MTPDRAADLAAHAGLRLSERELTEVAAIIDQTGSLAPETEVVARYQAGALTPGILTFFLPHMWRYREGDSPVPMEVWRAMFLSAEYTEDMVVQTRPTKTVRAYRGATEENREGISWTLDVRQAKYFAAERQAPGVVSAQVWVTNIPPHCMLARYTDGWEQEITADVRRLTIHPLEDEGLLPKPRWWWRWWPPRGQRSGGS